MKYKQITVKDNVTTHRVWSRGNKDYDGIILQKNKVYIVEKNTGFASNVYDLLVLGFLDGNIYYMYPSTFMVKSEDVIFFDWKGF